MLFLKSALVLLFMLAGCSSSEESADQQTDDSLRIFPPSQVTYLVTAGRSIVEIAWQDSNLEEEGYALQRRRPNIENWTTLAVFPSSTTTASDTEVNIGETYFYRVVAFAGTSIEPSEAERVTIADTLAPDTELLFHPPQSTDERDNDFLFQSNEGNGTFICTLDEVSFDCTSDLDCFFDTLGCIGEVNLDLGGGEHIFTVAAVDEYGNVDPTPASYTWTVDLSAPQLSIFQTPDAVTTVTESTILFTADESADFYCSVNMGNEEACESPFTITTDVDASAPVTFTLRGVDQFGHSAVETVTWEIDLDPPLITFLTKPSEISNDQTPSFRFAVTDVLSSLANEGGAAILCGCCDAEFDLDSAAVCGTSEEVEYTFTLTEVAGGDGRNYFHVFAEDIFGFSSTVSATWFMDTSAPTLIFTQSPPETTDVSFFSFSFVGSDENGIGAYYCDIENLGPEQCEPPAYFGGVTPSVFSFSVTAVDTAGNQSAALTGVVEVDYPYTTTDICLTQGEHVVLNALSGYGGLLDDDTIVYTNQLVDGFRDTGYGEFIYPELTLSYNLSTTASGVGPPRSKDGLSDRQALDQSLDGPACAREQDYSYQSFGTGLFSINGVLEAGRYTSVPWDFRVSWYQSSELVAEDHIHFSDPDTDAIFIQPVHPPRGSYMAPNTTWNFVVGVDGQFPTAITPHALFVTVAVSPSGTTTATTVLWDDLDVFDGTDRFLFVDADLPLCTERVQIEVETDAQAGYLRDYVQLPVSATTADIFEPNNTVTTATSLDTVLGTSSQLHLDTQDWYTFTVDSTDAISISGDDIDTVGLLWGASVFQQGQTVAVTSQVGTGDFELFLDNPDPATTYNLSITTEAEGCQRYTLSIQ